MAKAATYAASLGLKVNAGAWPTIPRESRCLPRNARTNIGHAIIGRAVMTGLKKAVPK
ncbi:pyridoxine 5'-phosphate synthase [Shigella flexneri]